MARTAKPHQLPSVSQPRRRHSRRMRAAQTKGTTIPIDLRSSVRQMIHSIRTELKMVSRPATAARQANAATVPGCSSVAGFRVLESEIRTQAVRDRKTQPRLQEQTLLPKGARTCLIFLELLLLWGAGNPQPRA